MSLLGKYRKEEERRDEEEKTTVSSAASTATRVVSTQEDSAPVAVPNKERKSPIMSFSVTTELRSCLQAVRNEKAINLSLWVEKKLRDALVDEFPSIAHEFLN
ncbi:MAG: hypothetical protein ACFFDR_00300 [Candidatus Thorarchaeota archaeon]